ncbi:MAG: apolipoprotein N-acyltransferase [Cyanobacteria bacterium P01_A01_bin.84]
MGLEISRFWKTQNFKLLISFISGILMGVTVAPVNAFFFAWFAFAPFWVLATQNRSHNSTWLNALFWGIGYYGFTLFWITGIHPMTWMGVPWLASLAIAIFCLTFITLWGTALAIAWSMIFRWIITKKLATQNGFIRVLIGTALWCTLEAIWSSGPLWWSTLAYTQSPHNLVILHLGQISGTTTVTAAIVAVNGLLAEFWIKLQNRPPRKNQKNQKNHQILAISAIFLFITSHLLGFWLYSIPLNDSETSALKVGIIQGNVPNKIKLKPEGFRRAIAGYTKGYLELSNQGVEAVLTPEGALPFYENEIVQSSLVAAVKDKGITAWIGGFGSQQDKSTYTNSLFTFTGDGKIFSRYDKAKLVPLGEYVPFRQIIGGLVKRLSPLNEHQVPGSEKQVFNTPFGRAIAVICYGSAFPELFRYQAAVGGQFILSSANNSHYSESMPAQHHAQDIMRAIETDRWAVRATNTGYSGIVDPHGKTLWLSGIDIYQTHADTVYRRQTQTLYVRWGDWLTPVLLVLAAFSWFLGNKKEKEKS